MNRVVFLLSSARDRELPDATTCPAGVFPHETVVAADRLMSAGVALTVLTPDGRSAQVDPHGRWWPFHRPQHDRDFLWSVLRTFARHADDIRVTLEDQIELGLVGVYRAFLVCQEYGDSPALARRRVAAAAYVSWRNRTVLARVLAKTGPSGLTAAHVTSATAQLTTESRHLAAECEAQMYAMPGFRDPVALTSLSAAAMGEYDAMFVPGGYAAMTDLVDNRHVERLLRTLARKGAPIAVLGHGSAALLSAGERADGLWMFDGYRITAPTADEENQTELYCPRPDWPLAPALQGAGAVLDSGAAWTPRVVIDRNLVSGQNAASTIAISEALLRMLGHREAQRQEPASGPSTVPQPTAPAPAEVVAGMLEALRRHDVEAAVSYLAPHATVTVEPLGIDDAGPDALRAFLLDLVRALPDLALGDLRLIETQQAVTALFTAAGTQQAAFAGVPDRHKQVDVEQAWRFVVGGGLITRVAAYWCQGHLYRRLDVATLDETVAE